MTVSSLIRTVALATLALGTPSFAEAQEAMYSDIWLVEEDVLTEGPIDVEHIGVGTLEAAYDPYEEYQVELKMYVGEDLQQRVWSPRHPTFASTNGSAFMSNDIVGTPPANCAEVDHWVYKVLQDQLEWFGRTTSPSQVGKFNSRYGYVGMNSAEQFEYVRAAPCEHGCQMPRKCIDSPNRLYLHTKGFYTILPWSSVAVCAGGTMGSDSLPPCSGPEGIHATGTTGCRAPLENALKHVRPMR